MEPSYYGFKNFFFIVDSQGIISQNINETISIKFEEFLIPTNFREIPGIKAIDQLFEKCKRQLRSIQDYLSA